jgi:riboflavin kinase/FMN adenylyltransferase
MPLVVLHSTAEWLEKFAEPARRAVVTVGNFDGVHLGHQELLRNVRKRAADSGDVSAVLTFYPHPAQVLRPAQAPALLMTLEQRLTAIEQMGIDAAFVLRFDAQLAAMSAEDFVSRFLVETMRARSVLVGGNFRFGHRQAGDVALLAALGAKWNFEVVVAPPVAENGLVVSSTLIRSAVREGRIEDANRMLGRPYALAGEIRPGTGQGRRLVVPTLNLATGQAIVPANGVYATRVVIEGRLYEAATNVGVRPTFNGSHLTIESYLLNFDENLTRGGMEVRFCERLREERKFPGTEALREQVLNDIERARDYFRAVRPAG